jgi:CheY-like chemotaxis protein
MIDDIVGPSSWGEITKRELEGNGFVVTLVSTASEAMSALSEFAYDIIVIDANLRASETGMDIQKHLREKGLLHPVILATGDPEFLSRPVSDYADALALGPTSFFDKTSSKSFVELARETSNRVDPIRRVLRLMKEAGLGDEGFVVNDKEYTVAELLESTMSSDDLVRSLRESLYALVLEKQSRVTEKL